MIAIDAKAKARFLGKVDKQCARPCWMWMGLLDPKRHGKMRVKGKYIRAHRISYMLFVAPIPKGREVLHRCDAQSCVNPRHLFTGTVVDRMRNCADKGRLARGERQGSSKLTAQKVRDIRTCRMSRGAFAELYGVSENNVGKVQLRRTWKHV